MEQSRYLRQKKELEAYLTQTHQMLTQLKIPIEARCNISIQPAHFYHKTLLGDCAQEANGHFLIRISEDYELDETGDEELKGTLLHELLHTIPGCYDHNEQFRDYCRQVQETYGINPLSGCDGFRYHHLPLVLACRCSCGHAFALHNPSKRYAKSWKPILEGEDCICIYCNEVMQRVS